jgi:hypothetical protein
LLDPGLCDRCMSLVFQKLKYLAIDVYEPDIQIQLVNQRFSLH